MRRSDHGRRPYRTTVPLLLLFSVVLPSAVHAWNSIFRRPSSPSTLPSPSVSQAKQDLLGSIDANAFNSATDERTKLVQALTLDNPTSSPGSVGSFASLAVGTWRVVYAPHIDAGGRMASFGRGGFDPVLYIMKPGGVMTSHAKYNNIPLLGSGWLSVSGTYSSHDGDRVCRVDFDKAWIRPIASDSQDANGADVRPYDTLHDVPDSFAKDVIQRLGRFFFVDSVSVFPVSYLDDDTIVFDFELLGTRICARKMK